MNPKKNRIDTERARVLKVKSSLKAGPMGIILIPGITIRPINPIALYAIDYH
jgi:hypothetical protein